jgi:hypothetical protein
VTEQLKMLPTGRTEDGKPALEARGPAWRWWEMDEEHWVGYPDKKVKVVDMGDEWLSNVLIYLAKWNHDKVEHMFLSWWMLSPYNSEGPSADGASLAFESECMRLQYHTTHRDYLERLVIPCLKALETEAEKRGLDVPAIPSYKCRVVLSREKEEATRLEWQAKRKAELAEQTEYRKNNPIKPRRKRKASHCGTCGKKGHYAPTCPTRKTR